MRGFSARKYPEKQRKAGGSQIYCDTWHVSSNEAVMFSQSIKQTAFDCPTGLLRQKLAAGDKHHAAAVIKSALT